QQLRASYRQELLDKLRCTCLDRMAPSRLHYPVTDPDLSSTLDEEQDLSGDVRIEIGQSPRPQFSLVDANALALEIRQRSMVKLLL
ncbi:MAG: hypothetical protein KDK08_27165, partial [Rhizobiaceae bacterium]|nr:hypothetical protein [Rhizobiaceae bacterium]